MAPTTATGEKDDPVENQFAALRIDEISDDDDDDFPKVVLCPKATNQSTECFSLDDLINGSKRMDVILFLTTLDELMSHTAKHYSQIKVDWRNIREKEEPPLTIIEHLMEASVAANMAISQVAAMERRLVADYPWMTTIYRLLSVLMLPQFVQALTEIVSKESSLAAQFKEIDAFAFLGDCLECGFRNKSDPHNARATLAIKFCKQWKIPLAMGQQTLLEVSHLVCLEVPLKMELDMNQQFLQLGSSFGIKNHSWLPNSNYIGKGRSIIHTVRLLQGLSNVIEDRNGDIMSKAGVFGRQWDEGSRKATKIQHDMDDLLMADILPMLINMCHTGLMSSTLPREQELLPFFVSLKAFVKNPEQPISWTLAFSVHSLLTSIFELQGSNHMHSLAETAKQSFDLYMSQIEWTQQNSNGESRPNNWKSNLRCMQMLGYLVIPPTARAFSKVQQLRAV